MKELVTRAELKGLDMAAAWMLASSHPARGIQLYVMGDNGKAVRLDLDVHEAGDLYAALEAHMENVAEAAPITPEERDRLLRKGRQDRILKGNLEAVRDEIAQPILLKRDREDAAEAVRRLWVDGRTASKDPERVMEIVRSWFPELADALDRLANS